MPFPDLTTAGFKAGEDASKFVSQPIDPSLQWDTEGGLYISRRRFTRDPGFTFTTAFTNITEADRRLLESHYLTNYGGSLAFSYVHPTTSVTYQVRYHQPFKQSYIGAGGVHRWNITDLALRTV